MMSHGLWNVMGGSFTLDMSVESIVMISGIVNNSLVTIWFYQRIYSFNFVTLTGFVLTFDVSCVWIVNRVFEFVVSRGIMVCIMAIMTYQDNWYSTDKTKDG